MRYRRIPDKLRLALDAWDRSFDDWGDDAQPFDDRFLTLARSADEGGVIEPKGQRFTADTGILPDITIPRTVEAIAAGRDPVMEAALT